MSNLGNRKPDACAPSGTWLADGVHGRSRLATFRLYRVALASLAPIAWALQQVYGIDTAARLIPFLVLSFVALEFMLIAALPTSVRRTDRRRRDGTRLPFSQWLDEASTFSLDTLALCGTIWATSAVVSYLATGGHAAVPQIAGPALALGLSCIYLYLRLAVLEQFLSPDALYSHLSQCVPRSLARVHCNPRKSPVLWLIIVVALLGTSYLARTASPLTFAAATLLAALSGAVTPASIRSLVVGAHDPELASSFAHRFIGCFGWCLLAAASFRGGLLFLCEWALFSSLFGGVLVAVVTFRRERFLQEADCGFNIRQAPMGSGQRLRWFAILSIPGGLNWIAGYLPPQWSQPGNVFGKALAQLRCDLLRAQRRYQDLIRVAERFNAGTAPGGRYFSPAIKNDEILARMWCGDLAAARDAAEVQVRLVPDNPFFHYTLARILWQQRDLLGALSSVDRALKTYQSRYGQVCFPASKHKMLFLWELALERHEAGDDCGALTALRAAEVECTNLAACARSHGVRVDEQLVHNAAAIYLIHGYLRPQASSLDSYVSASRDFAWCIRRSGHPGARLRLALIKGIGTRNYQQSVVLLKWIQAMLVRHEYPESMPFSTLIDSLIEGLEWAQREGVVLNERLLLYQRPSQRSIGLDESVLATAAETPRLVELAFKISRSEGRRGGGSSGFIPSVRPAFVVTGLPLGSPRF